MSPQTWSASTNTVDLSSTVRGLWLDTWAARATAAISARGVRVLLLKGAAIATWLYEPIGLPRGYVDVDLLVAPRDVDVALAVLGELGFRHAVPPRDRTPAMSHEWTLVGAGGAVMDLHERLLGIRRPADEAFELLWEGRDALTVGGRVVAVLGIPDRTVHLALHRAASGTDVKAARDLTLALDALHADVWARALARADLLDCSAAVVGALRLHPDAATLVAAGRSAEAAGGGDVELQMRLLGASPAGLAFARFQAGSRNGQRGHVLRTVLFPGTARLRTLSPLARRGRLGLIAARLARPIQVGIGALPGWLEFRRAARAAGRPR